jgi:DNA-binding YbaB/EbfC family protein
MFSFSFYFCEKLKKMLDKLMEMKKRMDEVKSRLDTIVVSGEADQGNVKVNMNGNRKVLDVKLNLSFLNQEDAEQLEELLQLAMNRALEQSERVNESEMKSVAGSMLPGMPGLF